MNTPILLINFKTYEESTGEKAVKLAKIIDKVSSEYDVEVAIAVQALDLREVVKNVKNVKVLAQHVDVNEYGGHTGKVLIDAVKKAGAVGTLVNHSEYLLEKDVIGETVRKCKEKGLITVVCAADSDKAAELANYSPDFIAVEPPELIGGDVSVSEANPDVIKDSVKKVYSVKRLPVLCGAGVHTKKDIEESLKLGAKGALVASGVVKDKNPRKEVKDLLDGFTY